MKKKNNDIFSFEYTVMAVILKQVFYYSNSFLTKRVEETGHSFVGI